MVLPNLIENLMSFNLTRQEAIIYIEFLTHGAMSGYEVSKETGISRSNVYSALQSLTEKGALYLVEGESTKYIPVSVKEFLTYWIRELKEKALQIEKQIPKKVVNTEGYITIVGLKNIKNKIQMMLNNAKERVYIMASFDIIKEFESEIKSLIGKKRKVVILSDFGENIFEGSIFHLTQIDKEQIRLIVDSSYVLTGEYFNSNHDTCLYSGQKNLVNLMKEALKNKIELLDK